MSSKSESDLIICVFSLKKMTAKRLWPISVVIWHQLILLNIFVFFCKEEEYLIKSNDQKWAFCLRQHAGLMLTNIFFTFLFLYNGLQLERNLKGRIWFLIEDVLEECSSLKKEKKMQSKIYSEDAKLTFLQVCVL